MITNEDIAALKNARHNWLVTGAAGFIGSHLVEYLLGLNQEVTGFDDLSSGHLVNLETFKDNPAFTFIEGDIRDFDTCMSVCDGADYVLHHAAIGSVPLSLENPELVNNVNNLGFCNILDAAVACGVKRTVYASSSAIYGNGTGGDVRHEAEEPQPLSPYAETKLANEHYAQEIAEEENVSVVGLRYFNIYGPRQDPKGAYAAVIPKWINEMLCEKAVEIYGDGETVRDFCYVGDVAKANIIAALNPMEEGESAVFNIAGGKGLSLNQLFFYLKNLSDYQKDAIYKDFRAADIKISCASVEKAVDELGFIPNVDFRTGLVKTINYYRNKANTCKKT